MADCVIRQRLPSLEKEQTRTRIERAAGCTATRRCRYFCAAVAYAYNRRRHWNARHGSIHPRARRRCLAAIKVKYIYISREAKARPPPLSLARELFPVKLTLTNTHPDKARQLVREHNPPLPSPPSPSLFLSLSLPCFYLRWFSEHLSRMMPSVSSSRLSNFSSAPGHRAPLSQLSKSGSIFGIT